MKKNKLFLLGLFSVIILIAYVLIEYKNTNDYVQYDNYSLYNEIDDKININTASWIELMNLDGVGEEIAKKIVKYRQNNGEFRILKDLMNIKEINENLYTKIHSHITV